jgi:hypothetical protein
MPEEPRNRLGTVMLVLGVLSVLMFVLFLLAYIADNSA